MKKLILLLPFIILLSCSVQKRKYQNGYYVEWKHKKTKTEQSIANRKESNPQRQIETQKEKAIEVNTGKTSHLESSSTGLSYRFLNKKNKTTINPEDSCDLIVFKDGSETRANVQEIGLDVIKYKRCDSPDGPMYVSKKSEIFMIKYKNGSKEVIKSDPPVATYQAPADAPSTYKSNKYKRVNHQLSAPALIFGVASIVSAYMMLLYSINSNIATEAILFLPFGLGLIATIMGAVSLSQIKAQPDVYKGKGMSIPGMIMGIVMASIMLLIIIAVFV